MSNILDLIAFDADDTLWHSENLYSAVQQQYGKIMSAFTDPQTALDELHAAEIRNLPAYGFGVKAFVLSMIEVAIRLSDGRVPATDIDALLTAGKGMLAAEVELLPGVEATISRLARQYPLMVITKGDLGHQASKLERSGLAQHFRYVEIVADKTASVYTSLFGKHGIDCRRVLMVGNSLKSDVIPVLELGGWGVFVPYHILWTHEHAVLPPALAARYREIESIETLPQVVAEIESGGRNGT